MPPFGSAIKRRKKTGKKRNDKEIKKTRYYARFAAVT